MAAKSVTESYWCRMDAGWYAKQVGDVRFDISYDPEYKLWHCRRNGMVFDAARTLREAKTYCVEPDAN